MQRDQELEQFKSEVNLTEYAASKGFELDCRESSRSSAVMRRSDDKIVVATAQDGHGIYFDVRDPDNAGTVIDFCQRETGKTLGQVRRELRPWLSLGAMPVPERIAWPAPSSPDRRQVAAKYATMHQPDSHPYLEQRGIEASTQQDPRFAGTFRADARGNAVFPHYDADGLAGYELKNRDFAGFSKSGQKALWHSTNFDRAERLVVVESTIDAMSHAQATASGDETAYISIGGQMSDHQRAELKDTLERAHDRGAQIEIATDNDEAGAQFGEQIAQLAPTGAALAYARPARKDWNDELQERQRASNQRRGKDQDMGM